MTTALILGAGADDRHHGGELDGATLAVATAMREQGLQTVLLNDNPAAFTLDADGGIDHPVIAPLTLASLAKLIDRYHPELLVPTLGSQVALDLAEQAVESGLLKAKQVELVGLSPTALHQVTSPVRLAQTLRKLHAPVKLIRTVASFAAARALVKEIGFPVIIRAVGPRRRGHRQIVHDYGELERAVTAALAASASGQAVLQQSLAGLKEVEVLVMRDQSGTMMELATVEDVDPIGIHAGDSMAVTPAQTLLDRELQDMRDVAFAITRRLRIVGVAHIQFALDQSHQRFYVIKTVPYYDRLAAFVTMATGYPVATVCGHLYAGQRLRTIRLAGQEDFAAVTEPSMDRTAVRLPAFPVASLPPHRWILSTEKQSVGAAIGLGRSLLEALLKAATTYDNSLGHRLLDQVRDLTADELDERLIHPRANRLLTLIEALRRGYAPAELSELTKIDRYYFDQLKRLVDLMVKLPHQAGAVPALREAKYWGMSDRQLARLWQTSPDLVRQLEDEAGVQRTFKEVDPTAGEFTPAIGSYYSTFEKEDEPVPDGGRRALLVGAGPRTLGNGAACDYLLAKVAGELGRLGYQVVAINDSPSSLLGLPQLTSRRYLEPRTLELALAIAKREHPEVMILPAPLADWVAPLQAAHPDCRVLTVPMLAAPAPVGELETNCFFDGQAVFQLGTVAVKEPAGPGGRPSLIKDYPAGEAPLAAPLPSQLPGPGLYQLTSPGGTIRPLPAPDLAFLTKVLGVNLAATWLDQALGRGQATQRFAESHPALRARYRATFPWSGHVKLPVPANPQAVLGAAMTIAKSVIEEATLDAKAAARMKTPPEQRLSD